MDIILASTSKYRKSLLEKLGISFVCESPNIDEYSLLNESAKQMAERLAIQKARAVASHHRSGIIIGSDQTASLDQQILGKPGNFDNARIQLLNCSGKTIRFHTGLCLIDANTMKQRSVVEDYDVTFKELTMTQIEYYLNREKPFDCAGSFKSEGMGIALFKSLEGRDPNSLVGLPLIALCELLHSFGVDVLNT